MAPTARNGRRPAPPSTPLIGREREQRHLDDLIDSRGLVTLTGRGGVGKSALALDAAERRRRAGSQLVAVVPLDSVVDPLALIDQVAMTVGVRGAGGDPVSALVRRLRRTPTLLVLDNAEHLTAAGPEISGLVAEVPDLSVVVTSQRRMGVRGERTLPIRPLETPAAGSTDLDEIAASPAVALYLERAAAVSGPWAPPPDLLEVGELCRRLEGLPLAIELAASRATTIAPGQIVSGDDRSVVDVLRGGPSDAPDRHRDLRATLAWSYDLLDPGARRLLRALALVHHPTDLSTVGALVAPASRADVIDDLSTLVDLHLVDPRDDGSFTIAPSIRTFAAEQLTEDERTDAVDRLIAWCTTASDAPIGAMVDVLHLALDGGRELDAHRLLVAVGPHWRDRPVRRDQRALVDRVLALPADAIPPADRARALVTSMHLSPPSATQAQRSRLTADLEFAEGVARATHDDELLLFTTGARVLMVSALGGVESMDAPVAEARQAADRLGDPYWIARCEQWAGTLALRRLDIAAAIDHGRAALAIAREERDDVLLAHSAMFLAPLVEQTPHLAADIPTLEEVLVLVRRTGLTESEVWVLPMLVDDLVAAGDLERATDLAIDALELVGDRRDSPAITVNLIAGIHLAAAIGEEDVGARALGSVRPAVDAILDIAPPYRMERHVAAAERLRSVLGDRFDAVVRAGAALEPHDAAELLVTVLLERRAAADLARPRLTAKEHEVLDLLRQGMSNKEIAAALGVRPKTVAHHASAIYRKLGVRGRGEAVAWAARNEVPGTPDPDRS